MDKTSTNKRRSFLKKLAGLALGSAFFAGYKTVKAENSLPASRSGAAPLMGYESYIGSIGIFAGNFIPSGWLPCDGRSLVSSSNSALYSVIGVTFGGNGTNFNLPDLRGRVPIGTGQGSGLTNRVLGASGGSENHTLGVNEVPAHSHTLYGTSASGTSDSPSGLLPAVSSEGVLLYGSGATSSMSASALSSSGGGTAHNNMQPFLALNFCICVNGSYPTRP